MLNPISKKLALLSDLNTDIVRLTNTSSTPHLVLTGYSAIEFYTNGACLYLDLDVLCNEPELLSKILPSYGFTQEERFWYNDEENLVIECLGYYQGERIIKFESKFGIASVLSPEEIILNLLEDWHWCGHSDNRIWAKILLEKELSELADEPSIDLEYLKSTALELGISDTLEKLLLETTKG